MKSMDYKYTTIIKKEVDVLKNNFQEDQLF